VAYVRTVKTSSGATAVQIVWSSRRGSRNIEHIGSAHDDAELEALEATARQRLAAGQVELDLGLGGLGPSGPLEIASSRMAHLWDALCQAYDALGFPQATGADEVFRQLVLARIIERASKQDSLRVLEEACAPAPSYATLNRRLPVWAQETWRQGLSEACAAHAGLGPASLVLYGVSTLYFEADQGEGFREPGFSRERRLDPQITIGLLTGQDGFPLMVSAFEGNEAETKTMLPVIEKFMAAHRLPDVTVVADAGMISEANQKAIEAAGLSFALGMKIPTSFTRWTNGAGSSRAGRSPTGTSSSSFGPPARQQSAVTSGSIASSGPPGEADAARDRRAGRQGSQGGRRARPGQAQPVHRSRRAREERQPRTGTESA
jgi:hypothetical protein